MEKNLKNETHLNIRPIEEARFTDKLETIYEQQWDELLAAAQDLEIDLVEFAIPIWKDESYPSVIRDRAMLFLIGKQSRCNWYEPRMGMIKRIFYRQPNYFDINHIREDKDQFKMWLDEALSYGDIIDDSALCALSYTFFTNSDWDQQHFEHTLESLDPRSSQDAWDSPFEDGWSHSQNSLPYIDDILHGHSVDKSNVKMKEWAKQKHNLFMKNFVINEDVLPSWLQDLERYQVRNTVENVHNKHENDEHLPENLIAIYEKYGLDFWKGLARNSMYSEKTNILKYLDQFSQESIIRYVEACYEEAINNFHTELRLDEEQALLAHIKGPLPRKLAEYATTLNAHRQKHEALLEIGRQEHEKEQALKREQDRIAYLAKQPERDKADQELAAARSRYNLAQRAFRNSND